MLISAFSAWPPGGRPARGEPRWPSCGAAAECRPDWRCRPYDVNRPRKRCSPHTSPAASKRLTADVVEIAGPMHGRARGRLGDDQQLGPSGVGAHLGRQRGEAAPRRSCPAPRAGAHAEARPGHDLQRVLPVDRHQVVAAVAEEREVVVGKPLEEGAALFALFGGKRRRRAARRRPRSRAPSAASPSSRSPRRARRPARARCRPRARRAPLHRSSGRLRRG